MNVIDKLDARELKSDLPELRPGDTVKVHVRVTEGDKERGRYSNPWDSFSATFRTR